jgi:hypothetical protein
MKTAWSLLLIPMLAVLGCTSGNERPVADGIRNSPIGSLARGEIAPDQYFERVREANEADHQRESLDRGRDNTMAFNTITGRYEFVPPDTQQRWNEETLRWEFTPVVPRDPGN